MRINVGREILAPIGIRCHRPDHMGDKADAVIKLCWCLRCSLIQRVSEIDRLLGESRWNEEATIPQPTMMGANVPEVGNVTD